jgi:hypothetical protein
MIHKIYFDSDNYKIISARVICWKDCNDNEDEPKKSVMICV